MKTFGDVLDALEQYAGYELSWDSEFWTEQPAGAFYTDVSMRARLWPGSVRKERDVKIAGKRVRSGAELFVKDGPNRRRKVTVVGFNLEGEPIVQAVDGEALEWPAHHRRHIVDMPAGHLSWDEPVPTLLEAAKAVVDFAAEHWGAKSVELMDDLRAAVEREEP